MKAIYILRILALCVATAAVAGEPFETDTIRTSAGELEITFIGHGTLMMNFGGKIIHIDPFGRLADYGKLPDADYIFITHHHGDHLDPESLDKIQTEETLVVLTEKCAEKVPGDIIMKNGDVDTVGDITVEAVPAYNIVHTRDSGEPYHVKGEGNGYVMTFGDTRIYIAGDTENIPEMKSLKEIDIAFLPMNLPYTMTPEMVVDAVAAFKPRVLYPYHYGDTDTSILLELLEGNEETEVRIRSMR